MSVWEIINSPIVITFTSLIWGSLVASTISYLWQKRSQRYRARVEFTKEIFSVYHEYIRLLKGDIENLNGETFDEIHANMQTLVAISRILFDTPISDEWEHIVNLMTNVRAYRYEGKHGSAEKTFTKIYIIKSTVSQKIYKVL